MRLTERMKRKIFPGNKGFSFLELAITIGIMAVLLGFAGIRFSAYLERGRYAKDVEIVNRFATAAVNYYSSHLDDFSDVRAEVGAVAFNVFDVDYYESDSDPFEGKLSTDLSVGIMQLTGFYDSRDIPRDDPSWVAVNSRQNFIDALTSKSSFGEKLPSGGTARINEVRVRFDFATRTVTVRAFIEGRPDTGANTFEVTVPF